MPESTIILAQNSNFNQTKESIDIFSLMTSQNNFQISTQEQIGTLPTTISRRRSTTSSLSIISTWNYTPHMPIEISTNAEFTSVAVSGTGIKTDPYVIKGWGIINSSAHAISITGTTAHFTIQNCYLETNWYYTGIHIDSVAPGTVNIFNNTCYECYTGIFISNSENAFLNNNICQDNNIGISFSNSRQATIHNNICQGNVFGISLSNSGNTTLSNNTCVSSDQTGISLSNSEKVILNNNTCSGGWEAEGIFISNSHFVILSNNICLYSLNFGISLEYSGNVTVVNNTCTQNGIFWKRRDNNSLELTRDAMVVNNSNTRNGVGYAGGGGISLKYSGNATIENNTCQDNSLAISLSNSGNATVVNNICQNDGYGMFLRYCGKTTIRGNMFIKNGLRVTESSLEDYLSYIVEENWVNRRSLGWLVNEKDSILHTAYGQLFLINCTNIMVEGQNCSYTDRGISLYYSPSCQLINNSCNQNCDDGIILKDSENATLSKNICSDNYLGGGICLENSGSTTLSHNICFRNELEPGLSLSSSWNCKIINNTCIDNEVGISIRNSKYSATRNNICRGNYNMDDPWNSRHMMVVNSTRTRIYALVWTEGILLSNSEKSVVINNTCQNYLYGISLENSENSTVSTNICKNNKRGISLHSSRDSIVINNTCFQNYGHGIFVTGSSLAMIIYNNCSQNNWSGIILDSSENVTISCNKCSFNTNTGFSLRNSTKCGITLNTLLENQGYGIFLDEASLNNTIHHNAFFLNKNGFNQAADNGTNNQWYDTATMKGNYWENHNGTDEYLIDGTAGARDSYPLVMLDLDIDGMPDDWEVEMGLNPLVNDGNADPDGDSLLNIAEYLHKTDPYDPDSDVDGMPDGWEVQMGIDPIINDAKKDPDKDGLTNLQEYRTGTDPRDSDSDDDFFRDGLDHKWWGNPLSRWDNPLTRILFLILLIGLPSLILWTGFIVKELPQLKAEITQEFQLFEQQVEKLQEHIQKMSLHDSELESVERKAEKIHQEYQSCEETFQVIHQYVERWWLPTFLRPDLTHWDSLFASIQETYEYFQQTLLERLDAKY
ncbi:MAG: NosD domain-containing protein [Candidatus Hodarchaeota archaeon]